MELYHILKKEETNSSKDLVIFFNQKDILEYGFYDPITNKIYINNAKKLISINYLLAHELQHLLDFKNYNLNKISKEHQINLNFNLELRAYARSSKFKQNNLDYLSENDFINKLTHKQIKKFNKLKLKFDHDNKFQRIINILSLKYSRPN